MRHPQRHVEACLGWSQEDQRVLLRYARAALVDATEDAARAREMFLRAVASLGAGAVVMYTEIMHDALELFVRLRGSLFLLGPLFDEQWEEYFARLLRVKHATPGRPILVRQRPRFTRSLDHWERQRAWWLDHVRAGINWPMTDMN